MGDPSDGDELGAFGHTVPAATPGLPGEETAEVLPTGWFGRLQVLEKLGEGGMGQVFSAYDEKLDRKVAVKLLHPRGAGGPDAAARLEREAQAMARLRHPNVVAVHDIGTADDQIFVAMEHVDGHTLREEVARLRAQTPLPWRAILDRFVAAGRGLTAVHAAGLVHRDFKPDNVLVDREGRVLVTDFGLVGLTGERGASAPPSPQSPLGARLTELGAVLGTPIYMAPEQQRGLPADARVDQFAFSVALYEALYGQLPFPGKTREAYVAAIDRGALRPPPEGSAVPTWVFRALERGLSARPEERFPSLDELLAEIQVAPERERLVGWRTRTFLVVVLGLVWVSGPIFRWQNPALLEEHGHRLLIAFAIAVCLAVFAAGLWARETLSRTSYNRSLALAGGVTFVAQVALAMNAPALDLTPHQVEILYMFLYFTVTAAVAATVEPRALVPALGFLAAFAGAAMRPDLRYLALVAANVVLVISALAMWFGPATRTERGRMRDRGSRAVSTRGR